MSFGKLSIGSLMLGASAISAGTPAPSVPFDPSLISTQLWYKVSDASTVNHTTNAVNTLSDKSGHARHISGTTTQRPTYDAANGKIVWNGTTNCLYNSTPFMHALDEKILVAVISVTTGANKRYVAESTSGGRGLYSPLQTGNSGTDQLDICPSVTTDANTTAIANKVMEATGFAAAKQIVRIQDKLGMMVAWINGVPSLRMRSYPRESVVATPNRFCVGGTWGNSGTLGNFAAMELYELIVVDSTTYVEQIEGYLAHEHGLTGDLPADHPYKVDSPMTNETTDYSIQDISSQPLITWSTMGDSLTGHNSDNDSNSYGWANCGNSNWYMYYSNGRLYIPQGNSHGNSGDTLSQMITRMATDLGSDVFDVCLLMGGTNQLGTTTVTNRRDQIDELLSYICLELGKKCVIMTITPTTDIAAPPLLAEANAFIMRHHGFLMGRIIAVDVASQLDDGTGMPLANTLTDNVHYTPYGAWLIGRKLDADLEQYFGRDPIPDWTAVSNLVTNGALSGTGGTGTGQIATGWTFTSAQPIAPTVTKTVEGYQKISSNYTASGADGTNTWEFSQTFAIVPLPGELYYAKALLEIENAANIAEVELAINFTPTITQTFRSAQGNEGRQGPIPEVIGADVGEFLAVTPDFPIVSSGFTTVKVSITQRNITTGLSTTSDVTIKGISLHKR